MNRKIIGTITDGEIVEYHIIGGDCSFSHHETHKVIKGYIQMQENFKDDRKEKN